MSRHLDGDAWINEPREALNGSSKNKVLSRIAEVAFLSTLSG